MSEHFPNQENNIKTQIIEALKEKGLEDAEATALLAAWKDAEYAKIPQGPESVHAQIELILAEADIYTEAALLDQAWKSLYDALHFAEQGNDEEMIQSILERIEEFDRENE